MSQARERGAVSEVLVPAERVERWVHNFGTRHGGATLQVAVGGLHGQGADGSHFSAVLPFATAYDGAADPAAFAAAVRAPADWGVLLVRKGGFAIARLHGHATTDSKVGRRHVQGRTKAGGQSQQRFARRRDNQARQAYEAAGEHAARILAGLRGPLVTGGDRGAVADVLSDPRLAALPVVAPWLAVPDPRRGILEQAVVEACSARFTAVNT